VINGFTCRNVPATPLPAAFLAGCVSAKKYDSLEAQYRQLNQSMSSEIATKQVTISRVQGAIKITINSELLFRSGGRQMPAAAQQTIAKMAPILAPQIQNRIIVNGYTSNTPIGPELMSQGVRSNLAPYDKRANTVTVWSSRVCVLSVINIAV
jgi:chemotaxis protein MotB